MRAALGGVGQRRATASISHRRAPLRLRHAPAAEPVKQPRQHRGVNVGMPPRPIRQHPHTRVRRDDTLLAEPPVRVLRAPAVDESGEHCANAEVVWLVRLTVLEAPTAGHRYPRGGEPEPHPCCPVRIASSGVREKQHVPSAEPREMRLPGAPHLELRLQVEIRAPSEGASLEECVVVAGEPGGAGVHVAPRLKQADEVPLCRAVAQQLVPVV